MNTNLTASLVGGALLLLAASSWGQATELQRCRTLADATQRLACFDAALPPIKPGTAPPQVTPAVAAAASVAAPAPAAATATAEFGLQPKPETQTQSIQSHLPGEFDGWEPRQKFTLANGQVWLLIEDSRGAYRLRNPKVTIRRGAIGSFLMDIEGVAQTLRVRRMQ
jgi:hypothetical protein